METFYCVIMHIAQLFNDAHNTKVYLNVSSVFNLK